MGFNMKYRVLHPGPILESVWAIFDKGGSDRIENLETRDQGEFV